MDRSIAPKASFVGAKKVNGPEKRYVCNDDSVIPLVKLCYHRLEEEALSIHTWSGKRIGKTSFRN